MTCVDVEGQKKYNEIIDKSEIDEEVGVALIEDVKDTTGFDDLLISLGEFGRYQKRTYFLLFLPTFFSAMQKQSWVFLGAKAPHRCKLPEEFPNASYHNPDINLTARIPWDDLDNKLSSCDMYQQVSYLFQLTLIVMYNAYPCISEL